MSSTRREFFGSTSTALLAAQAAVSRAANAPQDGPASANFSPLTLAGNLNFEDLAKASLSDTAKSALPNAPQGEGVAWGIPYRIDRPVLIGRQAVTEKIDPARKCEWLVFFHTADMKDLPTGEDGFVRAPMRGEGHLGEHLADYIVVYADGSEERIEIRRRHHIGTMRRRWGENCFQAVAHRKPHSVRTVREQSGNLPWGRAETRVTNPDAGSWVNWLYAWRNPRPEKAVAAIRFAPKSGAVIVSAISAGTASSHPLRWEPRKKAVLRLPQGTAFDYQVDNQGRWKQIQIDMGQVISAEPRRVYPDANWASTYHNQAPEIDNREVLIEYTAHLDARFRLAEGATFHPIKPATQRVRIRVREKESGRLVPVKLHLHGESGEYLPPVDRHRLPNTAWFEDYSPEFQAQGRHYCVYIDGETVADLPHGKVYLEVSKGFEIKPVRQVLEIGRATETVDIEIEKVLRWRERNWITADTHVHFLSPPTALLEGQAEGVNVVNLLASQWGELLTNVGDFDGKTTFGSKEAGGDGEWLVRVGTENRQHILGHISLLGYKGGIIAPMCQGGPDEAALGDPIGTLLVEWAEQCKKQGGVTVLPHFPNPRAENAVGLISGAIDAIEVTSLSNLYGGIDPYSLSDWYRYLNCGYFVACVGGTDKMSATTAVGTVRTYARLPADAAFTYEHWMEAVRRGHTFATYGPLMEFSVEGKPPGARIPMNAGGGTVDVTWELASVTVPMSKVELVVNGEVRESRAVKPDRDAGHWSVRLERRSWLALLVRGHQPDKPEIIAAHSSPVMVEVQGSPFFSALDAVTILDQIEGALAYIDTVGTRADDAAYKRIRMRLTSAHRALHNELHKRGQYHEHTPVTRHA